MSHMELTKNNLTNLCLNPGQLVRTVPDLLACHVSYEFIEVSRFLLASHVIFVEIHLHPH